MSQIYLGRCLLYFYTSFRLVYLLKLSNLCLQNLTFLFSLCVAEMTNSDWWFVKKHLTLEEGYVPAKLLAEETTYTHYVEQKIEEKANKLPIFDSEFCLSVID